MLQQYLNTTLIFQKPLHRFPVIPNDLPHGGGHDGEA
jgi:hypothetical protein